MDDGVCEVVLTFTSVDKILRCDHSNEISLEVLSYGVICFKKFYKMKFGILSNLPLVIFGSERVKKGPAYKKEGSDSNKGTNQQ